MVHDYFVGISSLVSVEKIQLLRISFLADVAQW